MLRFIKKILGITNPQDPYIFHYRDGTRKRSADPIAIEISLRDSLGKDWLDKVAKLHAPVPLGAVGISGEEVEANREKLRTEVLDAIDKAFGVHGYIDFGGTRKPEGMIEVARFGLLNGYIRFATLLIKGSRPFAKLRSRDSPSTVPPPTPST